jgi:branched-chain amino acid transport system ATP-binding protein
METRLDVEGLCADYGREPVLTSVSLRVGAAQVTGIVGPNGNGKTTCLRAISGLAPRMSGIVKLDGQRIDHLSAERIARLGVIHVPQGDLVYKRMSVRDNLLVGGTMNHSRTVTNDRLEHVLTLFPRLRERMSQTASSLSGGERRMLGIGRGLMAANMRLLMLDEPSLGLAPLVIDQIYGAINNLAQEGMAILIVEESVARIAATAQRLSLLSHGEMVWSGQPADLLNSAELSETYLGV